MKIAKKIFGEFAGKEVYKFTLANEKGNIVSIINYGATVISWRVTDKANAVRDIAIGFNDLETYVAKQAYMGCIAGRYANRIAHGKFQINGTEYQLACNNGPNHLHGGNKGFDKVIWDAVIIEGPVPKLSLSYLSKDGEEGYPGNLSVKVEYSYSENDELIIEYFAETDKTTPVNLTNHCYFNLTGNVDTGISDHLLQINADHYTPVNEHQIPTGELCTVNETVFDFTVLKRVSQNISKAAMEFDHNYILNKDGNELSLAAILSDPANELKLSVYTTEPGMQFYSGNFLDGNLINRDGKPINKHSALCLETQHFPDSPNQLNFPSTILEPGQKYFSKTVYKITCA
jgi:aldose 1-epimerase